MRNYLYRFMAVLVLAFSNAGAWPQCAFAQAEGSRAGRPVCEPGALPDPYSFAPFLHGRPAPGEHPRWVEGQQYRGCFMCGFGVNGRYWSPGACRPYF